MCVGGGALASSSSSREKWSSRVPGEPLVEPIACWPAVTDVKADIVS